MNKSSAHEAKALRRAGVKVTNVNGMEGQESVRSGGQEHDLYGKESVDAFVNGLGLPKAQSAAISKARPGNCIQANA